MKKNPILLLLFLFTIVGSTIGQEAPEKEQEFIQDFLEVVRNKKQKKILKFLDPKYKSEQLKNLDGNADQLVNELFSGQDNKDTDVYVTMKIEDITSIEIQSIIPLKGSGDYTCIFIVRSGEQEIYASLLLTKKGRKLGFVGALG